MPVTFYFAFREGNDLPTLVAPTFPGILEPRTECRSNVVNCFDADINRGDIDIYTDIGMHVCSVHGHKAF